MTQDARPTDARRGAGRKTSTMRTANIARTLCLWVALLSMPVADLLAQEIPDHAFLGIRTEPSPDTGGLRINYVFPASAAEDMGLKIGDHLLLVNDVRVTSPEALSRELRAENVGAKLRLLVIRDGKRQRVSGKIGSYTKAIKTLQDRRRKAMVGKPLPAPPTVKWWNGESKTWEVKPDALASTEGRVSVIFSFDGCAQCRSRRLGRFATMSKVLEQSSPGTIDFRGLYYKEGASEKESLEAAQELLSTIPTTFPIGVASYGAAAPTPESRLRNILLHMHGVAILGTDGNVAYLQIHGYPETEFYNAFKKLYVPSKSSVQPEANGTPE